MGIHTTFIPLLICTGIFGFTDAQLDFSRNFNSAVHKLFKEAGLTDEYDEGTIDAYAKGIWNRVNKTCEKNGGAGALMTAGGKFQKAQECMVALNESITDELSHTGEYNGEAAKDFMARTLCSRIAAMESCLNKFKKDNPCLGPADLEIFDVYLDAIIAPLKSICKNNGENLKKLMNLGALTCFKKMKCTDENDGNAFRKHIYEVISTSDTDELVLSLPDKEECAQLEKLERCYLNSMQGCEKSEAAHVTQEMWNEILVALRCRNSANSQSSPISLIILLIVTAFTALRF